MLPIAVFFVVTNVFMPMLMVYKIVYRLERLLLVTSEEISGKEEDSKR